MKRYLSVFVALLTLLFAVSAQAQTVTVIRNARVVDGTGAPVRNVSVVIRGGRIAAVGEKVDVPADAKIVDARGLTLVPGLFDLHTHVQLAATTTSPDDLFKNLKKYVAAGVTSVLNYSGAPEAFQPIRELLASGNYPAPHLYQSIRVSPPGGHGTEGGAGLSYEIANPAQAHHLLPEVFRYKPDAVKAFTDGWRYGVSPAIPSFNQQTIAAIVEESHKAGARVFTHTLTLEGSKIAARGGIDVQAHGVCDGFVDETLLRAYKEHGTGYVSTLAVYNAQEHYARYGRARVTPRLLELLEPASAAVAEHSDVFARLGVTDEGRESAILRGASLGENIRILHRAGVPLGVGTDAGMQGVHHGYATLQEIEYLVDNGLTPLEALQAATATSAKLLGVDKDYGTIAEGKVADLVLVEGEPDKTIADIEKTRRVWVAGVEADLPALLKAVETDTVTVLPTAPVQALVLDAERKDGRTNLDTLPYYTSDAAADHSVLIFTRIIRDAARQDHALSLTASFSGKAKPFVQFHVPLSRGSLLPADLHAYKGVSFEVRGEGAYRLLADLYGNQRELPAAQFNAAGAWSTVRINFDQLLYANGKAPLWDGKSARELIFELARPADEKGWLEIDNVRFY